MKQLTTTTTTTTKFLLAREFNQIVGDGDCLAGLRRELNAAGQ